MKIADMIAIIIVILFAAIGLKRGLVRSVMGLVSFLLSLILAIMLYPVVSNFLSNSPIGDSVRINVEQIMGQEQSPAESQSEEASEALNLPEAFRKTVEDGVNQAASTVSGAFADSVSGLAINLISMLAVFLLARLVIWVLSAALDLFTKLPIVHSFNRLLGGVLGAGTGILAIYLLLALLTFATTMNAGNKIVEEVKKSTFVSEMYNNNFILNFMNGN